MNSPHVRDKPHMRRAIKHLIISITLGHYQKTSPEPTILCKGVSDVSQVCAHFQRSLVNNKWGLWNPCRVQLPLSRCLAVCLQWLLGLAVLNGNEAFLGMSFCALKGKTFLSPQLTNGLEQGGRQLSGSFHAPSSDRN